MPSANQNVAYDLSLFEPRKAKVVQMPDRKKKANVKARKRMKTASAVKLALVGIVVLFMGVSALAGRAQLNEYAAQITKETKVLEELKSKNVRLQMQLESKMSTRNVEEYARSVLGMQKISASQIERVYVNDGDKTEVAQDSVNKDYFSMLKENVSKILS